MEQLVISILSMLHLGAYSTPIYFLIIVLFMYFNHASSAAAKKKRETENEKAELAATSEPAPAVQAGDRWGLRNLAGAALKEFEMVLPENAAQTKAQPPIRSAKSQQTSPKPEHVSFADPPQSMQTDLEVAETGEKRKADLGVRTVPPKTTQVSNTLIGWEAVHKQIEKVRPNHAALLSAIALAECLDRPSSPKDRLRRRLMYRKD